jgi:Tfp pilus assembly protein PilF
MTVQGFLEQFHQQHLHRQEKPFCFVLGAGASSMSKIPTGGELAVKWLRDLHRELDFTGKSLEAWATEGNLGIPNFDLKQAATFYSELYEKRFHDSPESGYAYLEDVMRDKEPSYGYSVLAYLLSETRHKILITTNFDNLAADALSIHSTVFPLVVSHDSLAHYARVELRRPLIAKVHGGLGFAPKSERGELGCLTDGWSVALQRIFERCSPIVIGYDGNDGSLMNLMESMKEVSIDNLRWCFYAPTGQPEEDLKRVPPRVQELVARQRGRLVPIPGFDEIMLLLQQQMSPVMKMPNLRDRMQERAKQRYDLYSKQESELNERVSGKTKGSLPTTINNALSGVNALLKDAMEELAATNEIKPWWQWDNEARDAISLEDRNSIYQVAIAALPNSHELFENYALFLHGECKQMDKAEEFFQRAINAVPKDANYLGNYAVFLQNERKDMDKAEAFYLRAIEADPKHANNLRNYALFLQVERKNMDKAEEFYLRAIEADPEQDNACGAYANFLKTERKNMDKAEKFYLRAVEADPKHANNLSNYAFFLKNERKNMDKAEEFYLRAIEADPKHANALGNYANFLATERKKMDKAEEMYLRAIEADPKHANNLNNYAFFLKTERKNLEKAEAFYKCAIDADPTHANILGNYAFFLQMDRKDIDKAEEFYLRAIKADPGHAGTLGNYANFLKTERKDMDKAEEFYKLALKADPGHGHTLNNYANFLKSERKDMDKAEEFYKLAIKANPKHVRILGGYALFLQNERKQMDKAEEFYLDAIEADPMHGDILNNYAFFLKAERKNLDMAEEFYLRAIEAEPEHAEIIGNYAFFLQTERKDMDKAELFYKRAIDADPEHANTLGNFAIFLQNERKDMGKAEEFYLRTFDADPKHANTLGNYAQLCFLQGKMTEGMKYLNLADAQTPKLPALQAEIAFYRLAHEPAAWPGKLAEMAHVLLAGARSLGWPLEGNVSRAKAVGHPNSDLLNAIAGVISRNEPLEGLSKFPEWPGTIEVQAPSAPQP